MKETIYRLPSYPSTAARKSLSPSQIVNINQTISSSLLQTIALPPSKRDTPAARNFVASYAKDNALQALQSLIWPTSLPMSKDEKLIRKRALLLAEKVAPALDIQTLLDLAIVYGSTNASQIRSVFEASVKANPLLVQSVETDLVPAFTHLFNPAQGLYAIRKAAFCVLSFLHSAPPEIVRCFGRSQVFVLALATLYDQGLGSIAQSYGGLSMDRNRGTGGTVDEWEPIWVQTKVDLIDGFHVAISTILNDLSTSSGRALALESERTFGIIFALLEIPSPSTSTDPTPFLNRSLLTDYQTSYSLSKTLSNALRAAAEKDARLDLLESTLRSLEAPSSASSSSTSKRKDAGALKILLGSSGISPGIDNRGDGGRVRSTLPSTSAGGITGGTGNKGKERAPAPEAAPTIPDLDVKITQVLDIFPDHAPEYVRALLERPVYDGDPEKVVMALLEGSAPTPEDVTSHASGGDGGREGDNVRAYVNERRNVFDDEEMDLSRLRVGKSKEDSSNVLRDRPLTEQMKADILRLAEAISDDEEEEESEFLAPKPKGVDFAFDEDEEGATTVKVSGGGEESGESGTEDEKVGADVQEKPQDTETILELAYIRDPKLFDRDAQTRRSKGRADLKTQTGWDDNQIEGWRIMLERNPRKDKILQKHEFSGNQPSLPTPAAGPSNQNARGGGFGGRGGRGRGNGGRGGGSGGGGDSARERAWKDKNKASRGNHNRKRGHDKKMARAGAGVPP